MDAESAEVEREKARRWARVRVLFEAALAHEAARWPAFLAEQCPDDAGLRDEVAALLEEHAHASGLFASRADESAAGSSVSGPELARGERVGPYRIEHLLGRGGMGSVYLATRADGSFQKRVALKVLRPGYEGPELAQRFRRERQILAALDHPGIARLLDGGTTEAGRPYLVLEYVEGVRVDRYCHEANPPLAARLDLFRTICAAVQLAHQNLVVHRDLKPSNILVTREGAPKLLDFGISKLLNPELGDEALMPTVLGAQPMTPDYASPEQLRGEIVTTATDIYSLGLLLYEILTGAHPFRRPGETPQQLQRRVAEDEPTRPSEMLRRSSAPRGSYGDVVDARRLKGDLDAIVLKALRKEPHARYSSVEQLSEDLLRFLRGQPVSARKGTRAYLFGKWAKRHRIAVASVATALISSLSFGAAMGFQARELARERDRAEAERARAEQERQRADEVQALLVDVFNVSDPQEGASGRLTAREALDRGAEMLRVKLVDEPAVKAELLLSVGTIYRRLGQIERARPLVEESIQLRRMIEPQQSLGLADGLQELGVIYAIADRYDDASRCFEEALKLRAKARGDQDASVLELQEKFGLLAFSVGDYPRADVLLRRTLAARRATALPDDRAVLASKANLGQLLNQQGRFHEAAGLHREVSEALARLHPQGHPELRAAWVRSSIAELGLGNADAAETLLRQALEAEQAASEPSQSAIASTLARLGICLAHEGRFAAALEHLQRSLDLRRAQLGDLNRLTLESQVLVAEVLAKMGRGKEAEELARGALERIDRRRASSWFEIAETQSVLAESLLAQGRTNEAEPLLLASAKDLERLGSDAAPSARDNLERLIRLYEATGRETEAKRIRARVERAVAAAMRE